MPCSQIEDTDFLQAVCLVPPTTGGVAVPAPTRSPSLPPVEAQGHPRAPASGVPLLGAADRGRTGMERRLPDPAGIFGSGRPPLSKPNPVARRDPDCARRRGDTAEAERKITRWYWCGVLGEQYGGSLDSRLPRDLEQVVAWVRGGRSPPQSPRPASPPPG